MAARRRRLIFPWEASGRYRFNKLSPSVGNATQKSLSEEVPPFYHVFLPLSRNIYKKGAVFQPISGFFRSGAGTDFLVRCRGGRETLRLRTGRPKPEYPPHRREKNFYAHRGADPGIACFASSAAAAELCRRRVCPLAGAHGNARGKERRRFGRLLSCGFGRRTLRTRHPPAAGMHGAKQKPGLHRCAFSGGNVNNTSDAYSRSGLRCCSGAEWLYPFNALISACLRIKSSAEKRSPGFLSARSFF